jgi:hypothetical protein
VASDDLQVNLRLRILLLVVATCCATSANCRAESVILGAGSVWKYYDFNAAPSASWASVGFDDSNKLLLGGRILTEF